MAFNFGTSVAATSKPAFGFTTTTTSSTGLGGFSFGAPSASTTTTASSLFGTSQSQPTASLGFGGGLSTGFNFGGGTTAKTTASTFGFGSTATTANTLGAFSLSQASTTAASSSGISSIWSNVSTASTKRVGLGGVDPSTSGSANGTSSNSIRMGDSKAVKESQVPQEIMATVKDFKAFLKEQKGIREQITRMSSKPMYKVQEEVSTLKGLLVAVESGLHNNVAAVANLKQEAGQELKHAEIAQRTKEIPRGLQYENTAPNDFFQSMCEDFKTRMSLYRQYIEQMESHLNSLSEKAPMTPQELADTLNKLHHSFLGVAAQLYTTHEAVKTLKERYLLYRQLALGDSSDVFRKLPRRDQPLVPTPSASSLAGPTPFTGTTNTAAAAIAAALNRSQQPVLPPQGLGQTGSLLGSSQQAAVGLFGAQSAGTLFGATTQPSAAGSLFGNKSAPGGSLFGTNTAQPSGGLFGNTGTGAATGMFGSSNPAPAGSSLFGGSSSLSFGGASQPSLFNTNQSANSTGFQLQSPPLGSKRNKKDGFSN